MQDMREVCAHESTVGPVVLDPSLSPDRHMYFPTKHAQTVSPKYTAMHEKKAHLVIRMLELRIGHKLMLQAGSLLAALEYSC